MRGLWLIAAVAGLNAAVARAELIEIAWNDHRAFDREVQVAPGKFVEICGKLAKGEAIDWKFDAAAPLDFNVHYHIDKAVEFPEKRSAVKSLASRLVPAVDQHYCWMWRNKGAAPVTLSVGFKRG